MNRRGFLAAAIGLTTGAAAASPPDWTGGGINAEAFGVRPNAADDQSEALRTVLRQASERHMPVFLPPGRYRVSDIELPRWTALHGVPGATRLVHDSDGFLLAAQDAEHVELNGLTLDGANGRLGDRVSALLDLRRVESFFLDRCGIAASGKSGISCERVSGRIEGSTVTGAGDVGIYSVEGDALSLTGNVVTDCGNGGILVHRWEAGADGASIVGNRVERIGARSGGTGQHGNGINIFRAGNVIVSNNHVADCAFSAVRANSSDNVQIVGNQCLRSGETAIYSEFSFEGAVINSNIVDTAAVGISIANFNEGGRMAVCNGNIVRNLVDHAPYEDDLGFGVGISVEADTAVTGNVVEGAPLYGMMLGWGPFLRNVVATGNVVRESDIGFAVSVVEGTGAAVITDNIIEGAKGGAIVGHRWAEAVTGDLAIEGAPAYPNLVVESNNVV